MCSNLLLNTAFVQVKPDTIRAICYKTIAHGHHSTYAIYLHRIVFMQRTLLAGEKNKYIKYSKGIATIKGRRNINGRMTFKKDVPRKGK